MSYLDKQTEAIGRGISNIVEDIFYEKMNLKQFVTSDDIEHYIRDELDNVLDERVQNILEHKIKIAVELK